MNFNENNDNPIYDGDVAVASNPFAGTKPLIDTNSLLMRVFKWMALGLGISAISAYLGAKGLIYALYNGMTWISGVYIALIIIELILVLVLTAKLHSMSESTAKTCFIAYSIINGLTLSSIFLQYTVSSITATFVGTATMFGAAAIYGKVTKKDLASWGTYLMMGLVGIIVASIINMFLGNSNLDFIISVVGVLIFVGLTAYDVNRIEALTESGASYGESGNGRLVIWGALQLYLDFVNLFLKLLRFMGKKNN